jgi:D-psicose/D-tagatose/L-ribulose 3-epimerase
MHFEDWLSLCHLDPGVRSRSVDRLRDAADLAAAAGAQLNLGAVRGQLPHERREAAADAARESFHHVIAHARAAGVPVAVEPLSRSVCNWINSVEEAIQWIAQFEPQPSLVFDVYQLSHEEPSVHAALIRAWPHLSFVRISDSNRCAPGLGHYPFPETVRILAALGYQGYLSVECRQSPDSATAARQAAAYLAPLLAEVGG